MNKHLFVSISVLCLFVDCIIGPLAGGSTDTELGSVVAGSVTDGQGEPVANAPVVIIPQAYDPVKDPPLPDSLRDTTDFAGRYRMRLKGSGIYNILATDRFMADKLLIAGVRVDQADTTKVAPGMLDKPGYLRIVVPVSMAGAGSYVYLPGTTFFAKVENGTAVFSGVPAGFIPGANLANAVGTGLPVVIKSGFTVAAGDTAAIAWYGLWKFNRRLFLNTTAAGADVAGTVTNFPVFVRLSNANFDFSRALGKGEDLRFTKPDDTPLDYEIEQWDSANATAAVWLKVDTVYGNSDSRWIVMYWGGPDAAAASSGPAVFNSTNGYQGVWHLGMTPDGRARDASPNGFDGTPSDTAPLPIIGMVGGAQEFNGSSSYFTMKGTSAGALNFPENGTYSISAWAYTDTLDGGFHTIIGKGGYGYNLEIVFFDAWEFAEYKNMAGWDMTTSAAFARQWVYLTGVRKGTRQYLYVNGQCVDSTIEILPPKIPQPRNSSVEVTIGKIIWPANDYTPYFYDGGIDEVRVADRALSADWVKLCYMNQKAGDALVIFK